MNALPSQLRWSLLVAAALFAAGISGCHRNQPVVTDANNTADPADANLAASDGSMPDGSTQQPVYSAQQAPASVQQATRTRVLGARAQNEASAQGEEYAGQQAAPIERRAPEDNVQDPSQYGNQQPPYAGSGTDGTYDQGVQEGMDAVEEADQPPPPLPVYQQPACPDPNSLWTPGYWNYASAGYYWVPGAWVAAPYTGALWTPGYWGYYGHRYRFHRGFWGPHVGFYGGIPYGFGYTGYGYQGGYWDHDQFRYNQAVNRIDSRRITNVYNHTVVINNNTTYNRISYNGGNGGIQVQPRPAEVAAMRESHTPPMQSQTELRRVAASNRQQFFAQNQGRPASIVVAQPLPAQRGIATPAVRLPSANAPRPSAPAAVQAARPNSSGQSQAGAPHQLQQRQVPEQQNLNQQEQQRAVIGNPQVQERRGEQQRLSQQERQRAVGGNQQAQEQQSGQQRTAQQQHVVQQLQRQDIGQQQQQRVAQQQRATQLQQQQHVAQQQQGITRQQELTQQRAVQQQEQRQQQRLTPPQQVRPTQSEIAPRETLPRPQATPHQPSYNQPRPPEYQSRPAVEPRPQMTQPQMTAPRAQPMAPRAGPSGPPPSAPHVESGRPR